MKILMIVIWIVSIVTAFVLGRISISNTEVTALSAVNQRVVEKTLPKTLNVDIKSSSLQQLSIENATSNSPNSLIDKDSQNYFSSVHDILAKMNGRDFALLAQAQLAIENLDEIELAKALNELAAFSHDPSYQLTIEMLLAQYAKYAPIEALKFIDANINKRFQAAISIQLVLTEWAKKEPLAALNWVNSQELKSNPLSRTLTPIFKGLASQDINLALSYLLEVKDHKRQYYNAVHGIASSLKSSLDFINLIETIGGVEEVQVGSNIYYYWFKQDSESLLNYVDNINDSAAREFAKNRVFNLHVEMKPDMAKAANWYVANSEGDVLNKRVIDVTRNWAHEDPESALNWVMQQPNIDTQQATYETLRRAILADTDFVSNNIELLNDMDKKAKISIEIYHYVARVEGTKQADNFLQNSPYRDAMAAILNAKE